MPFIGNQPALSFTSFAKQDFTTSATTSYTLDNPVANANELALFINFVRQEPTTAYSASGTTLTLTEATSSSDDMYCVYLGKAVQTVNPPNGSVGTSQLASGNLSIPNGNLLFDTASKGIYLGVTSATASNLLSDYEEGTFTPTIEGSSTAGTASYSTQVGKYTKIGNMVTIQIQLSYSSGNGSGTAMYVKGLPFTSSSSLIQSLAIAFTSNISIPSSRFVRANIGTNSDFIRLFTSEVGGGAANDLAYDGAGDIAIGGTYFV